jgi:hypothetical protein
VDKLTELDEHNSTIILPPWLKADEIYELTLELDKLRRQCEFLASYDDTYISDRELYTYLK